MKVEVFPGRELPRAFCAAWSERQRENSALASPYFRPEYTEAVASVRKDVFVAVIDNGEAFFPYQRDMLGLSRPVGGSMTDYEGIISPAVFQYDPMELVAKCGLKGWSFNNVPASQLCLGPWRKTQHSSPCTNLETKLDLSKSLLATTARRRRRHEKEFGPLRFEFDNRDPKMLDLLMKLKSQQYIRTGATNVFRHRWTRSLVSAIHRQHDPAFAGVLSVLWSKDDPVAMQFSMRSHGTLHQWFKVYAYDHRNLSPGMQLSLELIDAAPDRGIKVIDIGYGHEPYKLELTNSTVPLNKGFVSTSPSLTRWDNFARRVHRKFDALCFHPRAGAVGRFMDRTYGSWLLR